ncbi:MAG: chromosome segregation protein SMC [Pseudomonadota bacterium]
MQFSKLRLVGFKSFVDPTELQIAPGLTGVVGPNGCGKSNLLEALRWVMGESRPTAMRGAGMEDVIFAGAAARPARHFAEVMISVEAGDTLPPAIFAGERKLDIVRRITRDAGSAYKTNGKDARARDVQMLFADASTGAHSPALVRQGQISELINAKPKARRRVLEEAAGISGLYQRRHDAELKLKATETNLARIEDVLEAMEGQLASLGKQARQAARYRTITEDLLRFEGMLLYRQWQEADAARLEAEQHLAAALARVAEAEAAASAASRHRTEREEAVPPLREEDAIAGAVRQRLQVERDGLDREEARARAAIEDLATRLASDQADLAREGDLGHDAEEMIARLTWEIAQLEEASEGQDASLAEAEQAAHETSTTLLAAEEHLDALTAEAAQLAAQHQEVARQREEAAKTANALRATLEEDEGRQHSLTAEKAEAAQAREAAGQALDAAHSAATTAEAALTAAEAERAAQQAMEAEARARRASTDGALRALEAETKALHDLLAQPVEAGARAQILDAVAVAPGYEAALAAAFGDDLSLPRSDPAAATGWTGHASAEAPGDLPADATPLTAQTSAPGELGPRLAAIGVVTREDGARLQAQLRPGQRLVSREGDLWRWDGLRVAAGETPSAAANRLRQRNRLDQLLSDLDMARGNAEAAETAHAAAGAKLAAVEDAERTARAVRRAAESALADAARAQSRSEAGDERLALALEDVAAGLIRRGRELEEATAAEDRARAAADALDDLEARQAAVEAQRTQVAEARSEMLARRAAAEDIRRENTARTRRLQDAAEERAGWHARQSNASSRVEALQTRIAETMKAQAKAAGEPEAIAAKRAELADAIAEADARVRAASDALTSAEAALKQAEEAERGAERQAADAREVRARAEATADAARARVAEAAEKIRDGHDRSPEALLEDLATQPENIPPSATLEIDIARLRRQRDALGAVNLRAEEDARAISEERDGLLSEKSDLDAAVAKLRSGISALNREGRQRLVTAYEQVNANFSTLFKTLFGGGDANLVMVESDDPLDAGLEIMCQPPGKRLASLSLLSGGEQTLTALSLIFAVFLANPSPICVLDEVDAPLDDANVNRFCDLLDEMTKRTDTRFLIITHHAVTMSRMDRLYGVTMVEQGVSQLVSVDLRQAEELVES